MSADRVNLRTLAGFLDITEQRVLQLTQKGIFNRGDDKLIDLREGIKNYIDYKTEAGKVAIQDEESGLSFPTFAERDNYYKSEDRRISLKKKTGELYEREEVSEKIFSLIELTRETLLILPDIMERDAGLNTKQIKAVQKTIDKKLKALENKVAKL